jgi:hypothetical protein
MVTLGLSLATAIATTIGMAVYSLPLMDTIQAYCAAFALGAWLDECLATRPRKNKKADRA